MIQIDPHKPEAPQICELWTIPQMLAVAAVILALGALWLCAVPNVGGN